MLGFGLGLSHAAVLGHPRRLPPDSLSAAAAYSLRRLRTAYTGPAIRVRRSSDNAEQDIGFTAGGDLDTTALLAFVGSGSGFVRTWYDQSGDARHVTQGNAALQPRIVNAGVVETEGARPTVRFVTGANQNLRRTDAALATVLCSANWAAIAVTRCADTSQSRHVFGNRTGTGFMLRAVSGGASWQPNIVGAANVTLSTTTTDFQVISTLVTAGQMSAGKNGSALTVGTTGTAVVPTSNDLIIGGGNSGSTDWSGPISELVIIGSALSAADRQALERNQGAYYGIAV